MCELTHFYVFLIWWSLQIFFTACNKLEKNCIILITLNYFLEKTFLIWLSLNYLILIDFKNIIFTFKNKNCVGTNKKGFVVNKINDIDLII